MKDKEKYGPDGLPHYHGGKNKGCGKKVAEAIAVAIVVALCLGAKGCGGYKPCPPSSGPQSNCAKGQP